MKKNIQAYFEQNKSQGWILEPDSTGRLILRDKNGEFIKLPPELFIGKNNLETPPGAPESGPKAGPDLPSRQDIEKQILEFAEKNKEKGYTWERDQSGFIGVKDKDGKRVLIPREIFSKLEQGDHSQVEKMITKYAEEKGLLAERDKDGFLVLKDQQGKMIPLPPEAIGKSKEDIEAIEKKIFAFAQAMKYTADRNEYGFLVVKDKDGVIVPVPLQALNQPSQPPLGPTGPNQPFAPGVPSGPNTPGPQPGQQPGLVPMMPNTAPAGS